MRGICFLIPMLAALAAQGPGSAPGRLEILYPAEASVFPPEIGAPLFLWRDQSVAGSWRITIRFGDGLAMKAESAGGTAPVGAVDGRAVAPTNEPPVAAPAFAGAHSWRPEEAMWGEIKRRSSGAAALVIITGIGAKGQIVSEGRVRLVTSKDAVGAPIFYRDVPLMPSETKKGTIKPLAPDAIRLVQWRLRDIGKAESRVVLTGLPACANCHSFSADGKTLGMDLDGPDSDKGTYAVAAVAPQTTIGKGEVMTWNSFVGPAAGSRTIGFMSRISPDGQHVVSTVNEEVYTANFRDYRFLQVFYPTRGILAVYSRATGRIEALPGADDPRYVHTNAVWSRDGQSLVFARAEAKDSYPPGGRMAESANDANELEMRYELYRIPFNGGKGGRAVAIRGAGANGKSNSFPKVSPDGRWIVYVQSRNGQLMRPDSELYIVAAGGGEARRMNCNTALMNSWHSFSPNGRWMVFSSKSRSPYTQMFLTHIDEAGNDSLAILIENSTAANRAVNIPEFINIQPDGLLNIDVPAAEFYRLYDAGAAATGAGDFDRAIDLWTRAVALEPDDARAVNNLGVALGGKGRLEEAAGRFRAAIALKPDYAEAHYNLGGVLARTGRSGEALVAWETALRLMPDFAAEAAPTARALAGAAAADAGIDSWRRTLVSAYNDRGAAAAGEGRLDEAEANLRKALELDQDFDKAHYNLGRVLARRGSPDAAAAEWLRAVEVNPEFSEAQFSLASVEGHRGRWGESLRRWLEGLRSRPGFLPALKQAAWIMATAADATLRDGKKAAGLAEEAVRATYGRDAQALDALAAAYGETGRFQDAAAEARKALALSGGTQAEERRERLRRYESGQPWREARIRR